MPKYQIEDTETGRTMIVEGDAPPSDVDVQELFANVSEPATAGPELRSLSPAKKAKDALHTLLYRTSENVLPFAGAIAAPVMSAPGIAATGPFAPATAAATGAAGYAGGKALHRTLFPRDETLLDSFKKTGNDLTEGLYYELLGPTAGATFGKANRAFGITPKAAAAKRLLDKTDVPTFEANLKASQQVLDDIPGAQLTPGSMSGDNRVLAAERQLLSQDSDSLFKQFMRSTTGAPSAKTRLDLGRAGNAKAIRGRMQQTAPGNYDDLLYALQQQSDDANKALDRVGNVNVTIGGVGDDALNAVNTAKATDTATKNALYAKIPDYEIPLPNLDETVKRIRGGVYDQATQKELDSITGHIDRVLQNRQLTGMEKAQAIQRTLNQRFQGSTPGAVDEFASLKDAIAKDRATFDAKVDAGDVALFDGKLVYPGEVKQQQANIAKRIEQLRSTGQGKADLDAIEQAVLSVNPAEAKVKGETPASYAERITKTYNRWLNDGKVQPVAGNQLPENVVKEIDDLTAKSTQLDDMLANLKPADSVTGPAQEANKFYREVYAPKYKQGTVGQVLERGNESNRLNYTPEEIGRKFLQSPTQAQDLIRAVGQDDAAAIARNWYQSEIRRMVDDGKSAKQVRSFMQRNRDVVNAYGIGQDVWPLAKAAQQREVLAKVTGMEPKALVDALLAPNDGGKSARELMARVKGNKAAEQGLQRIVMETIEQRMTAGTELIDGEMSLRQIKGQLAGYDKALKVIYRNNPGAHNVIKQAQELLIREQRINKQQAPAGLHNMEMAGNLGKMLLPMLTTGAAGATQGMATAGTAVAVTGAALAARKHAVNRLLTKAMFEPDTARELLRFYKGDPKAKTAISVRLKDILYASQPISRRTDEEAEVE
jgi:hypothetical protein